MRGQEYTVMNYLVWAVFAAIFAGIVMVVSSQLATPMEPIFMKETKTVFLSAYRSALASASCHCAHSNGSIAYSAGFELTDKYVQNMLGKGVGSSGFPPTIIFHAGTGFRIRKAGGETDIVAVKNVQAQLVVCCDPFRCEAYFNEPHPDDRCP